MSQYLIDCNGERSPKDPVCTMSLYTPPETPPATEMVYAFAPNWVFLVAAVVVLAFIIAVATVRINAHDEKGITERARIKAAMETCQTCGAKAVTE